MKITLNIVVIFLAALMALLIAVYGAERAFASPSGATFSPQGAQYIVWAPATAAATTTSLTNNTGSDLVVYRDESDSTYWSRSRDMDIPSSYDFHSESCESWFEYKLCAKHSYRYFLNRTLYVFNNAWSYWNGRIQTVGGRFFSDILSECDEYGHLYYRCPNFTKLIAKLKLCYQILLL